MREAAVEVHASRAVVVALDGTAAAMRGRCLDAGCAIVSLVDGDGKRGCVACGQAGWLSRTRFWSLTRSSVLTCNGVSSAGKPFGSCARPSRSSVSIAWFRCSCNCIDPRCLVLTMWCPDSVLAFIGDAQAVHHWQSQRCTEQPRMTLAAVSIGTRYNLHIKISQGC